MNRQVTDILVVGGGAAGLSAAAAAASRSDLKFTIIDDNPMLGGQIWRAELAKTRSPEAIRLIDTITAGKVEIVNNATVFASNGNDCLIAETPAGPVEYEFHKLVIATGARERFLPFPGWTIPNVFGAGGLQALVKGGLKINGKRIVVAGAGPLLLAVADYLRTKGAVIVAIAEQSPASSINRFAAGLWRSPSKLFQAASIRKNLMGVTYLTDCWVTSAQGTEKLQAITLYRKGKSWQVECDLLACGFHLVPNTELAAMLGCRIKDGFVEVDEFQRTSLKNVFCAGEPTGIGGVGSSIVEGTIAGLAAAGDQTAARKFFRQRDKAKRFADALNRTFAVRDEIRGLSDDSTIVCRCEDVDLGRLRSFDNSREAKLQTRCGMGACQGRVCGPATEFLFGWKPGTVRPPLFPVKMEHL